jgi:hypothetical protein
MIDSKIPVILHHGFIADGFEWILNSVDKALGCTNIAYFGF